jgi:hypothetical protein
MVEPSDKTADEVNAVEIDEIDKEEQERQQNANGGWEELMGKDLLIKVREDGRIFRMENKKSPSNYCLFRLQTLNITNIQDNRGQ